MIMGINMAQNNEIIWNDNQQKVIDNRNGNMLVSASAGSGKTTVMLERVLEIIQSGTPINRICILAFNKSIASEIRQKLYRKLLKKIEESTENKEHLCEQADNINLATIVTNDAFCNKLVKEFFQILNVDTNSEILCEAEAKSLYSDSYKSVVENLKTQGAEWIYEFENKFNGEQNLANQIIKINNFASVHPNKKLWIEKIKKGVYNVELEDSDIMKFFFEILEKKCNFGMEELDKMSVLVAGDGGLLKNVAEAKDILNSIKNAKSYKELYTIAQTAKFSKRSAIRSTGELYYIRDEIAYCYDCAKDVLAWLVKFVDKDYSYYNTIHCKTTIDVLHLFELYELVDIEYTARKQRSNKTDFADISEKAVALLEDEKVVSELRKRYDYVCVDEYQDTNYLQEFIFTKISNGNNLFMVGDSKQSIYRFRMSEPSILINKFDAYNGNTALGTTVHLDDNYRSDMGIINFVNDIFNVIMTKNIGGVDYKNTDRLGYGAKYIELRELPAVEIAMFVKPKKEEIQVKYLSLDDVYSIAKDSKEDYVQSAQEMEAEFIAKHIKSIVGKKKIYDISLKAERLIRYSDCVILSASGGEATKKIIKAIQSNRIPIDTAGLIKLNQNYEVEILNDWLRVIDNDLQDLPLTAILASFWGGLDYQELTDIRNAEQSCEFFYQACLKCKENSKKLKDFYILLDKMRLISTTATIADILKILVYDYGYDKHLLTLEDGEFKLTAVESYLKSVEGLSKSMSLAEYVASLGGITVESVSQGDGDVVKAMTIHKSKGLEFPIVYLCNVSDTLDKSKGLNTSRLECHNEIGGAINYFDEKNKRALNNFVFKVLKEKNSIEQKEEKMRLFYVALTRAKNHLIISGSVNKAEITKKNPYKVNSFWEWISNSAVENIGVNNVIKFYDEFSVGESVMEQYSFKKCNEKFFLIDETLDFKYPYSGIDINCKYSVTEINQLHSYEDTITNVYESYSEEEIFTGDKAFRGINYHSILENIDYEAGTIEEVSTQLDKMVEEGVLKEEDLSAINQQEILDVLNSDIIKYASKNKHYREREFMLCIPACEVLDTDCREKILIQGAIDLIIDGEQLIVVDFKKSNASSVKLKERYSKQLELYAMATESALNRKVDIKMLYVIGRNEIIIM